MDDDALSVAVSAGLDAAPARLEIPLKRPATVTAGGRSPVAVVVDGDSASGVVTTAQNLTNQVLVAGDRVMVEYQPPHGVFVRGLISLQSPVTVLQTAGTTINVSVPPTTAGLLRVSGRLQHATTTGIIAGLQFNLDTTSTAYNHQILFGIATTVAAAQDSSDPYIYVAVIGNEAATRWTTFDGVVPGYSDGGTKAANGTAFEPRNGSTTQLINVWGGYWDGVVPITSVQIVTSSGNFAVGSWLRAAPD